MAQKTKDRAAVAEGQASVLEPEHKEAVPQKAAGKKKPKRGALGSLRAAMPAIVLGVLVVAFVARVPVGNLSSFGWETISLICPVGALSALLASKSFIPQAVISLVLVVALVAIFGRAFCSWVCSVPLMQNVLGVDPTGKKQAAKKAAKEAKKLQAAQAAAAVGEWSADAATAPAVALAPEGADEAGCASKGSCASGSSCSSCQQNRQKLLDSRHWILGGSLVSAAVFGFPVFCVVCPVGLTFAMVFLIVRLFSGSVSWALLVVPAILIVELVFLRKWCHQFCPIGAFMSLCAKLNKTFVPTIDKAKCIETTTGHVCGRCAKACPERIDLRNLAAGERPINECVKCRQCVDVCPKKAVSMPLMPGGKKGKPAAPVAVADGQVTLAANEA